LPLGLYLGGALLLLLHGNPLETQEMRWLDQVLRWRAKLGLAPAVDPHIVHLDLDTDELEKLPDLAAEYRNAADLITEVSELHASVIVFDIVFGRGSRESAQPILDAIERAKSKNCSVVLAEFLDGPLEVKRSFPFGDRLRPFGLADAPSDADGVLRHYAFVHRGPDGLEPSLALAAYLVWRKLDWSKVNRLPERGIASWTELSADYSARKPRQVSVEPVILNFRTDWDASGPGSFHHYSHAQLHLLHSTRLSSLDPNAPPLEGRIVIVSWVAAGVADVGTTPLRRNQPKALVHSTALSDLIQNTSMVRVPPLLDGALLGFILPLAWATRLCRGTSSLFLLWMFGIAGVLALGCALIITPGCIIGSVAMGSLWTIMVIGELGRRYSTQLTAAPPPKTVRAPALQQNLTEPQTRPTGVPARVVYSYSHKDETLRDELETHLALLKQHGVIASWYDRRILPGEEWAGRIDEHFRTADIILLLISADFLSSNYCYEIEMKTALGRHEAKEARVVPIILRDVDWHTAPFGKLQALPRDGKPITLWTNRDEAWATVARGIRGMVDDLRTRRFGV
jgi:CHASE2 domain-containing sensor protein